MNIAKKVKANLQRFILLTRVSLKFALLKFSNNIAN